MSVFVTDKHSHFNSKQVTVISNGHALAGEDFAEGKGSHFHAYTWRGLGGSRGIALFFRGVVLFFGIESA